MNEITAMVDEILFARRSGLVTPIEVAAHINTEQEQIISTIISISL